MNTRTTILLAALAAVAGCSPFVELVSLDEDAREKARAGVRYYEAGQVAAYTAIQPIRATSCKFLPWDPPCSQEDAFDQLRAKAAALGGNGVTNVTCDGVEGMSLSKNCWSSITCRGIAIRVTP